jgi:hypothetical protein
MALTRAGTILSESCQTYCDVPGLGMHCRVRELGSGFPPAVTQNPGRVIGHDRSYSSRLCLRRQARLNWRVEYLYIVHGLMGDVIRGMRSMRRCAQLD